MTEKTMAERVALWGPSVVILAIGAGAFLSMNPTETETGAELAAEPSKQAPATKQAKKAPKASERQNAPQQQAPAAYRPAAKTRSVTVERETAVVNTRNEAENGKSAAQEEQPMVSGLRENDYRQPYRDWTGMSEQEQRENAWRRCARPGGNPQSYCDEEYGPRPADTYGEPWKGWDE